MRGTWIAGLLAWGVCACAPLCRNTTIASQAAPGGKVAAVMFQRDCGATTGVSTQVSVAPPGSPSNGTGNVFVADLDHGAAKSASWGGPWAELVWLSPEHLHVRYDAAARVFSQQASASGVRVSFQAVSR